MISSFDGSSFTGKTVGEVSGANGVQDAVSEVPTTGSQEIYAEVFANGAQVGESLV